MANQLLLVRHAVVPAEYVGRYVGSADPPLAPQSADQLAALAEWLRPRRPAHCVCSPLLRARQTAAAVAAPLALSPEVRDDLREIDFGRWEGMSFEEIAAAYPDQAQRWVTDEDFTFPGGESTHRFHQRVAHAADLLRTDPADRVLVVTHGGVVRAMLCRLLNLPPQNHWLFEIRYASCATVRLSADRGTLLGLNEPSPGAP